MNNERVLWNSFRVPVCASLSYVKRKEPHCISIQLEWRPTGQFFDSIQLIVFKITCSFQTVVRRDSCTQMKWLSLYANYCTNFLPIFTMCPVTLLMNILDICMNNQTAHRRADCLFVGLECCWDDTAILCTQAKVICTEVRLPNLDCLRASIHSLKSAARLYL